MEETPELKAREQASQDLANIAALKKFAPFNDYFMRRLRMKLESASRRVLYETGISPEEREAERLRVITLDEVLKMMAVDERISRGIVEGPSTPD